MNWSGGYVSNTTMKRNLFWVVVVMLLATLHGCIWLQWQQAKDETDTIREAPALPD